MSEAAKRDMATTGLWFIEWAVVKIGFELWWNFIILRAEGFTKLVSNCPRALPN